MILLSTLTIPENGTQILLVGLIALVVVMIGNMVFKSIKKKKIAKTYDELKTGDSLVLGNGMNAGFVSRSNGTVEVELSSGVRARFMEWAVVEVNGKKL